MRLMLGFFIFSLVAVAGKPAGHGAKQGSNVAPTNSPAGRSTAQLNDQETADAVAQALEDFREVTGQTSNGTGERASSWTPQSMSEMGR